MSLGVLDHLVDLVLGEAGAVLDLDRVLLAGALVLRGDVHDAVGVDVEGHLDLRDTPRCRSDATELEGAEQLVVLRHLALALEDLDLHGRLVVLSRGECLGTLRRDGGVALDELGHHATLGLDAQGQRSDVEQEDVLNLTAQNTGLQGCADSDDLVRVHALVRLLAAGQLLDQVGHGRHAGGTTDQDDVLDLVDVDVGVLKDGLERLLGAVEQVLGDALELSAAQRLVQEQRVLVAVDGDVRQVDACLLGAGELDLRLFSGLAEALQGHLVLGQVDAVGVLELLDQPVDDRLVPVVTAELVVTGGCTDLDDTVADLQEGDVEGTATEVEDQDGLFLIALLQAVCQRCGGRLVDDAQDVQACDLAGILGCLALGVVEVSRHGDDRVGDVLAQVGLGVALQLHQGACGDLLCGVLLVVDFYVPAVVADVSLDGADGAVNVGDRLVLCGLTDQNLAVLSEGYDGRRGACALGVGDNSCLAALEHRHHRVRGSKVNTYCASHCLFSFCCGFYVLALASPSLSLSALDSSFIPSIRKIF